MGIWWWKQPFEIPSELHFYEERKHPNVAFATKMHFASRVWHSWIFISLLNSLWDKEKVLFSFWRPASGISSSSFIRVDGLCRRINKRKWEDGCRCYVGSSSSSFWTEGRRWQHQGRIDTDEDTLVLIRLSASTKDRRRDDGRSVWQIRSWTRLNSPLLGCVLSGWGGKAWLKGVYCNRIASL